MKTKVPFVGAVVFGSLMGFAQQVIQKTSARGEMFTNPLGSPLEQLEHTAGNSPVDATRSLQRGDDNSTVSVEELKHKLPKRASKDYKKGLQAYARGDYEGALSHFQNTIQSDPDFASGHNDLGVVLEKLGNRAEAIEEFQRAVDLAPHASLPLNNLCLSFYALGRYSDVVRAAHMALKNDSSLLRVRYLLAVSLVMENGDKKEALDNLELVAPTLPKARLVASEILIEMDRRNDAAVELTEYLRSVPNSDPSWREVEVELAQLQP